jgi:hypothetical protein
VAAVVAVAVAVGVSPSAAPDSTTGVPPYPNADVSAVSDVFDPPVEPVPSPSSDPSESSSDSWSQVPVAAAAVPVNTTNVRRESFRSSDASLPHPIVAVEPLPRFLLNMMCSS